MPHLTSSRRDLARQRAREEQKTREEHARQMARQRELLETLVRLEHEVDLWLLAQREDG